MWYTRCNTSFFYQKLSPLYPLSVTFIHVLHRFGLRPEKDARPPGSAGISFHVYFFFRCNVLRLGKIPFGLG